MLNLNFFKYFYFGEIGNETMFNIAMLYKETVVILLLIMYVIIGLILYIIENFNHEKNKFPIYFGKETESTLDIIFVLFPTLIIGYLVVPAVGYIYNTEYNLQQIETLFNVTVIGHQWYWTYEYSINICNDSNLELLGDNFIHNKLVFDSLIDMGATEARLLAVDKRLVLPSNSYISLLITSEDVIHSWALPQLGIKVDAIPGRVAELIFFANINGIYYGQCSELCGVNHAFMPISLETVSYLDFLDFLLISLNFNPSELILNKYVIGNDYINNSDFGYLFPTINQDSAE